MQKKWLIVFLIMTLLGSSVLAGCGGGDDDEVRVESRIVS